MTTSGMLRPTGFGLRPASARYSNREKVNPLASASNVSSESARTVVSGPRTIATRIAGLASFRFESCAGVISADIGRIVDCNPVPRETENRYCCETFSNKRLTSAGSGFQLDLEIALSGVPAKPDGPSFSPAERCVEASGDVIKFLLAIRKSEVKVYFTYFTWRRIQQCRTRLPQRLQLYGSTYPSTSAMPAVLFFPRTITV